MDTRAQVNSDWPAEEQSGRRQREPLKCALCGRPATLVYAGHPGYQAPSRYDIYACRTCDARFAHPLEIDSRLYDAIYSQAALIPGYDRYVRYAEEVLTVERPLDYLASADDNYWAIRRFLERSSLRPPCRLLEVGSGLGYLSYSLVKAGYDVQGMDVSEEAVKRARARYGTRFVRGDFIAYARENKGRYHAVIMNELIEHVPNVREFVAAAKEILAPGGFLFLTTPNKSFYSDETLWETEAPPVHLWWFSEKSMRYLAHEAGLWVEFADFSDLNRFTYRGAPRSRVVAPSKTPMLDERGRSLTEPVRARSWKTSLKKKLPPVVVTCLTAPRAIAGYARFKAVRDPEARTRRGVMGVSLRKPW